MRPDATTASSEDVERSPVTPPEELFESGRTARRGRRSRTFRVVRALCLSLLATVIGVLVALPRIASTAWARRAAIEQFNHQADGATLAIDDWTWRWLAPSRIDGIRLETPDNTLSLQVRGVTLARGPLAWLGRQQNLGEIVIEQPVLTLIQPPEPPPAAAPPAPGHPVPRRTYRMPRRPPPAAPGTQPSPPPPTRADRPRFRGNPSGTVVIRDARLDAFPLDSDPIRLTDLSLLLHLEGREGPVRLDLGGHLAPSPRGPTAPGGPARLAFRAASLEALVTTPESVPLELEMEIPALDLAAIDAMIPSGVDRPRLRSGLLQGSLSAERSAMQAGSVDARITLRKLRLDGGAGAANDIVWEEAGATLVARATPETLHIEKASLFCPWLTLQGTGSTRTDASHESILTLDGTLDLPALLVDLEALLTEPSGLRVPRGQVRLVAEGTHDTTGLRWFAQAQGVDVEASWQDRPLPLNDLRVSAGGRIDRTESDPGHIARNHLLNLQTPFARIQIGAGQITADGQALGLTGRLEIDTEPLLERIAAWGITADPALAGLAPRLQATLDADWIEEILHLRSAHVEAGPLTVDAEGRLSDLHGARRLQLEGRTHIDWDAFQSAAGPLGWTDAEVSGQHEGPFQVSLPLAGQLRDQWAELNLAAVFGAARLAGKGHEALQPTLALQVAQGRLDATLEAGVNDGRLQVAPSIDGLSSPPRLTLPPDTRILQDVRLTDAILDQLLARVHPVLKHSTALGGTLSLEIEQADALLSEDWQTGLNVQSAGSLKGVRLGPKGVLAEIAAALNLGAAELVLPDQTLRVAVRNGRVHPQDLALQLGRQPLRAVGSVGLDGSLDYALEIPVTPELVGRTAFRALEGRVLRIPFHGSAAEPRIDGRALERELRSLLAAVATETAVESIRDRLREHTRPEGGRAPQPPR